MIPGGLHIPLPAPSLACLSARPGAGTGVASCIPAGCRGVRVHRCAVEVSARATCTLVQLCVHASMGLWGRGGETWTVREGYVIHPPHP
jgi:hypothetical protein